MDEKDPGVGYERMVGQNWSVGLSGVYRDLGDTIEDITLNEALGIPAGQTAEYRLTNPGGYFTGYIQDDDGNFIPVAFDQTTVGQYGFPEPVRKYYAADLTFHRRYADNWLLQGGYTWSHSYGNYEGYVRSDNGQSGVSNRISSEPAAGAAGPTASAVGSDRKSTAREAAP